MKIKDITIQDIKNRTFWKFDDYDEAEYPNTEIAQVNKISKKDQILHSALLVSDDKYIYPFLVSKYYEDGGEVGEFFIYLNDKWLFYDKGISIKGKKHDTLLAFISTLDHHEYQKGSFDNRKANDVKFNHYIAQIGNTNIIPFVEKPKAIPKKFQTLSIEDKMKYIKVQILEAKKSTEENKIAKNNKIQTEIFNIIQYLKTDKLYHQGLRRLLFDEDQYIASSMMYDLYDIFPKECKERIVAVSKEDTLEGLVARMKLKELA